MNNSEKKNNGDSKKIYSLLVLIAVVMITTTGGTYAYFAIGASNNNKISGTAATADLSLSVEETLPKKTNTGSMVPQRESALATAMNTSNACVDGNTNIVCKVYTIKVTNNSTAQVKVNGTIQFANSTNMPNLKWRLVTGVNTLGSNATNSANNSNTQTFVSNESLTKSGGNKTYYIIVWINAQMDTNQPTKEVSQTDKGTFTATIDFKSSDGLGVTSTITG